VSDSEADKDDRVYELFPDQEAVLAAARKGAVEPAGVMLDQAAGVVIVRLDPARLPTEVSELLVREPPPDGYDTNAQWFVTDTAPGSGYSALARYQVKFSRGRRSVAEVVIVFDICEHAEPLELAARGASIWLTLAGASQVLTTPSVDMAPVSVALCAYAAHKLPAPGRRQQATTAGGTPKTAARHWAKTNSLTAAEKHTQAVAGARRGAVGTLGEAVFEDLAITAARAAAPLFQQAHPLVVSGQLLNSLPDWDEDRHAYQYGLRARLPLPVMYIDLAGKHGDPLRLGEAERWAKTRVGTPPAPLHGALCWEEQLHGLAIVPFGVDRLGGAAPEPRFYFQFTRQHGAELEVPDGRISFTTDEGFTIRLNEHLGPTLTRIASNLTFALAGPLITTVLSVLYLLESANVELRPAALLGKAARRAAASGQTPASVIHIRSPHETTAQPAGGAGKLTGRHWRRGSYAHYPPHTAIGGADPEKLTWVPERGGYYRKIWRRATIVGPADGPIRLKTRKWTVGPDPRLPG